MLSQTPKTVTDKSAGKLSYRTSPLLKRWSPLCPRVCLRAPMLILKLRFSVADIIRSCLGPKAMLKMLLDPMGGIVLTNDGHAILREIEVAHPAAKSMIELSRAQDEEVGDGTTTVIILGKLYHSYDNYLCSKY